MFDQAEGSINIVGARTNNLKNISLSIPRNKLVVVTGRSGSGKSSLAIDTLFAEGQRQYIESLSIHSRQFFSQLPRADVDRIDGLQPTLAIQQHRYRSNRRSTVGTLTEVYDFLRLLMSRAGRVHCHGCNKEIQQQTPAEICDRIVELPERTKVMVLSPLVVQQPGAHQDAFKTVRGEGLVRVRVDEEICDIEQVPVLDPNRKHTIEAVADRIIVRDGIESRLLEAIDNAVRISSDGQVICCYLAPGESDWRDKLYSTRFACPDCDIYYSEVQPRSFSFNSPLGACETCFGLGAFTQFAPEAVIDRTLSVGDGAVIPWRDLPAARRKKQFKALQPVLLSLECDLDTRLSELDDSQFEQLMHQRDKAAPGLSLVLEKELATELSEDRQDDLEALRDDVVCHECRGARVSRQARSVLLDGRDIGELVSLPLDQLASFFGDIAFDSEPTRAIAQPIVKEIQHRLQFLLKVGVGYLTLGRPADSLSGGEHQRVRLAASVGAGVTSVCFVLDEPSTGLHARDTDRLLETLQDIQSAGNSVVVVEHDDEIINNADHVVEIGPGAGTGGGHVTAEGTPSEICDSNDSITGKFLSGASQVVRANRKIIDEEKVIAIRGAAGNNLKAIDVDIPLEVLCVVSGVSGSGKSTLIGQTLVPAIRQHFDLLTVQPAVHGSIAGLGQIEHFVVVDQRPIGRSPRACPATFVGLLDEFRKLFVATKSAKQLGFGKGRFTFNAKSGWCPSCHGLGHRKVEMAFMPDVFVSCDACGGRRFNLQTLQIKFAGRSIADVLALTIDESREVFANFSRIKSTLEVLVDVGLGYLKLGQSATTLSGGEAQRLKLARQLTLQATDVRKTLFILDEPTSGLHSADVQLLLDVLDRLVEAGHSVVVIEHHLDVIRNADWVIDLGPNGGTAGGKLIAACRPEELPKVPQSITGQWLRN